jgi:hypothetical protein
MKNQLLLLFLALTANVAFSQETNIKAGTREEEINQKVKLFQQFLNTGDKKLIQIIISKNPEEHLEEKLEQMQKQLPKGNVFTEKISSIEKNEFLVVLQIKPFGIPLSIVGARQIAFSKKKY